MPKGSPPPSQEKISGFLWKGRKTWVCVFVWGRYMYRKVCVGNGDARMDWVCLDQGVDVCVCPHAPTGMGMLLGLCGA